MQVSSCKCKTLEPCTLPIAHGLKKFSCFVVTA